jgi:hypothetical protein
MLKTKMAPTLVLAIVGTSGCSLDLTSPGPPPPEIAGTWTVSIMDAGPGFSHPNRDAGTCLVDPFQIHLSKVGNVEGEPRYSGTFDKFRMVCSGVTESATEVFGLVDTVVVVAEGWLRGNAYGLGCIGFQADCGDDPWRINLEGAEIGLSLIQATRSQMSGLFSWHGGTDTSAVAGQFSAGR